MKKFFLFAFVFAVVMTGKSQTVVFEPPRMLVKLLNDTVVSFAFYISSPVQSNEYELKIDSVVEGGAILRQSYSVINSGVRLLNVLDGFDTLRIRLRRQNGVSAPSSLRILGKFRLRSATTWTSFNGPEIMVETLPAPTRTAQALPVQSPLTNSLLTSYQNAVFSEAQTYNCGDKPGFRKTVQEGVLDSNLTLIYGTVIFGSSELIKTGTAAGYSQDASKGTVSLNYTHLFPSGFTALNIGLTAKATGGINQIYSSGSWSSDVGASLGFTKILRGNAQFFDSKSCEDLLEKRNRSLSAFYKAYEVAIKENRDSLVYYRDSIQRLATAATPRGLAAPSIDSTQANKLIGDIDKRIATYDRIVRRVTPSRKIDTDLVTEVVKEDFTKFDFANDNLYGYRVTWIDLKLQVSNNRINLSKDALPQPLQKNITTNNLLGLYLYASINSSRLGLKTLSFLQGQISLERLSFIDQPVLRQTPVVTYDAGLDRYPIIDAESKRMLGYYNLLNRETWSVAPSFYGAIFFAAGMRVGWDLKLRFRSTLSRVSGSDFINSFDFLSGPIVRFKMGETNLASATVGVKAGFSNTPVGQFDTGKNFFGIKLEVGVPFQFYYKGKS